MKKVIIIVVSLFLASVAVLNPISIAAEPAFKLRLQAHLIAPQMKRTLGTLPEWVKNATNGTVDISLFPVGSIVPFTEILEAVGKGVVDMALFPEGSWYKTIPVTVVGQGIPFCFSNWDEARNYMFKKGYVKFLRSAYEKHNVYVIPHEPFAVGLMTKKPIKKVEDLKGVKLRAYGIFGEFLGKLGAATTLIPGGELYTA
ncbi:MAG: hypothetical protein N2654_07895, partial [Deltaproteobacteria bacterium]|nr:hypothetical protein [Deltaproteobacteria bacterium]